MSTATYEEADKKRTYPITFRLPESLVADLKNEADISHISLNALVKQILDRYIIWERYSNKMGLVPVTRPFLKDAIDNLSTVKIKAIAYNASKDALKELVLITKGNFSVSSLVAVFNEWLVASHMTYRYEYDGNAHHYVISHNLGEKWSLYLSELLTAVCKDLNTINPLIQIRNDSVSVSFPQVE
ncbi:MAG: hypothetical protein ACRD32_07790 [Nitrososphaerales archaeon]